MRYQIWLAALLVVASVLGVRSCSKCDYIHSINGFSEASLNGEWTGEWSWERTQKSSLSISAVASSLRNYPLFEGGEFKELYTGPVKVESPSDWGEHGRIALLIHAGNLVIPAYIKICNDGIVLECAASTSLGNYVSFTKDRR